MLPFAWPTIKGPNFCTRSAVVVFLLPLVEGKGKGGNASAVIEEGLKSIKRHLWTDNVVVSPIDLISQIRECFGHFVRAHFLYLHVATHSHSPFRTPFISTVMSMFGRGSTAPSGAVNPERVEMAIQECVFIPFTTCIPSDPIAQVGHVHGYF